MNHYVPNNQWAILQNHTQIKINKSRWWVTVVNVIEYESTFIGFQLPHYHSLLKNFSLSSFDIVSKKNVMIIQKFY